jgi:nicotinamide-nucleotide amidase
MNEAEQLVRLLEQNRQKLVLAESCTGGLIAAELAKVPGVSNWLCGSAVTYRSETKTAWLDVDAAVIQRHTAVCTEVAGQMVQGVLRITPEADIAAAITGHLGPDAPADFDGVVFIATALRGDTSPTISRHQLMSAARIDRQREAAKLVLQQLINCVG